MIAPVTAALAFIVSGAAGLATFAALETAIKIGPKLEPNDFLPTPPWEGLPLPRFVYKKPEILEELRRK